MTDAIITDINEYRARKAGVQLASKLVGKRWPDARLQSRYKVLKQIEDGNEDVLDPMNPIGSQLFPDGFSPETDPGHNIAAIRIAATRRGVELS